MKLSFHELNMNIISLPCYFPHPEKSLQSKGSRCYTVNRYRIKTNINICQLYGHLTKVQREKRSLLLKAERTVSVIKEMQLQCYDVLQKLVFLQEQRVSSGRFLECFSYFKRF